MVDVVCIPRFGFSISFVFIYGFGGLDFGLLFLLLRLAFLLQQNLTRSMIVHGIGLGAIFVGNRKKPLIARFKKSDRRGRYGFDCLHVQLYSA
jgi:hypothetical protein